MMAPFYKYGLFGDEVSLIVAFVIGLGFGFVLERAGFGNARVLAAQFYFRDLRVLKVMFTAIVTAMVGLFLLSWLGFVDLSLVYLTPTFLVPQIVGGLILGAGFIIGGYCPGTSCVSAATGRIDGMVYVAGMVGGLLGFGEVYPHLAAFAKSTAMGQLTIPAYFNVPYGLLVLAVVLMALAAFIAAEWAEQKFGGKTPDAGSLLAPTRALTPLRKAALAVVGLGVVAAIAGNPYRGPFARVDTKQLALDAAGADPVAPAQLADWLVEGRNDFQLVDVREPAAFAAYHLPGAVNVPLATLSADVASRAERLILCADQGPAAAQAWFVLRAAGFRAVHLLAGGLDAWKSNVLFPVAPAADAPAKEQIDFARRVAVAKFFGGAPRAAATTSGPGETSAPVAPALPDAPKIVAPPTETPATPPPPKRKKKEGC
jgi:rhodanese-related sulfurtransferase